MVSYDDQYACPNCLRFDFLEISYRDEGKVEVFLENNMFEYGESDPHHYVELGIGCSFCKWHVSIPEDISNWMEKQTWMKSQLLIEDKPQSCDEKP